MICNAALARCVHVIKSLNMLWKTLNGLDGRRPVVIPAVMSSLRGLHSCCLGCSHITDKWIIRPLPTTPDSMRPPGPHDHNHNFTAPWLMQRAETGRLALIHTAQCTPALFPCDMKVFRVGLYGSDPRSFGPNAVQWTELSRIHIYGY